MAIIAWNSVWEEIYNTRSWGKYPPEPLIRFVARNYYNVPNRKDVHFLDLGSGIGSATWYLSREGFSVTAIDGSKTAIELLKSRLLQEGLKVNLCVGDVIELPFPDGSFDCVVDLACLMCNDLSASELILKEVNRVLKNKGQLFSFTPQTTTWGYGIGRQVGPNTFTDAKEGPYAGMGLARFSSLGDVESLYGNFFDLHIDFVEHSVDNRDHVYKSWLVVGSKRS